MAQALQRYEYTQTDSDGWSYGPNWARFDVHLARGESHAEQMSFDFVRRRRWVRTSTRRNAENLGRARDVHAPSAVLPGLAAANFDGGTAANRTGAGPRAGRGDEDDSTVFSVGRAIEDSHL